MCVSGGLALSWRGPSEVWHVRQSCTSEASVRCDDAGVIEQVELFGGRFIDIHPIFLRLVAIAPLT